MNSPFRWRCMQWPSTGARQDVEGGKQRRGAVRGVLVDLGPGMLGAGRAIGAGALQGLNLAFLLNGQHHRVGGRSHVEADHILYLGGEGG